MALRRLYLKNNVTFGYNGILKFFNRKIDLEIFKKTFLKVTRRALSNHAKKIDKKCCSNFDLSVPYM